MVKVTFTPDNKSIEIPQKSTILEAAVLAGVQIESHCGGQGTCGKCKVKITSEKQVAKSAGGILLNESELAVEWVLACNYKVEEDIIVQLSRQKDAYKRKTDLKESQRVELASSIQKYAIELNAPTIEDQTSDWDRLVGIITDREIKFSNRIASNLSQVLHQADFKVTMVLDGDSVVAVEPGDTHGQCYGLAIDIGTTTAVVYLLNLSNGFTIDSGALTNPQKVFGADVLSRITYASQGREHLRRLQQMVVEGLNGIIARLCRNQSIRKEEIYQAVVVGNTAMSHIFLGIDPTYLASAPFIPVFRKAVEVEARELGLNILETGHVIVLPNVAGYVGADTVGVMLAAKVDQLPGYTLAIDIGTNGEMVLAENHRMLTCSTAAGPAFEGAEIKHGMRAAEGAIEGVIINDDVEIAVIGETKPQGICGSGLIDAIFEMVKTGIVDHTGRLATGLQELEKLPIPIQKRIRKTGEGDEFVLVWAQNTSTGEDIIITQKDIRELQLAKGAIRAGIEILMTEMGINRSQLDRVFLAGAFGNYINKEKALGIGLLPRIPAEKISAIGNAAGNGAKMALLSGIERTKASELANHAEHIELSIRLDFQERFLDSLGFDI